MLQRESLEEITTIAALLLKVCLLLASMLFPLNFVKFMGDFCKVKKKKKKKKKKLLHKRTPS